MVIYVAYDLKKPGQDYGGLIEEIKQLGAWCHVLESAWLVDTSLTPQQVFDRVSKRFDQNDSVFIVELKPGSMRQGWLSKEKWSWIDARL